MQSVQPAMTNRMAPLTGLKWETWKQKYVLSQRPTSPLWRPCRIHVCNDHFYIPQADHLLRCTHVWVQMEYVRIYTIILIHEYMRRYFQ